MTNKEIIAVVTAAEAGKPIQAKNIICEGWRDCPGPLWNFERYDYRVKLGPREIWLVAGIPFTCKHEATVFAEARGCPPPVHYREVL